jgi:hypothetical protein
VEARVVHAERPEDPVRQSAFERAAGGACDEDAEDVGTDVIQPALAGLGLQGQRGEPSHPLIGGWRPLRTRWALAQLEGGRRVHPRLATEPVEVHPDAEREREQVSQPDRVVSRDGVLQGAIGIAHHHGMRELRQPLIHHIVEPGRGVGDERQARDAHDRLRHRRDPEDGAPLHRPPSVDVHRPCPPDRGLAPAVEAPHGAQRPAVANVLRHPLIDVRHRHHHPDGAGSPASSVTAPG